MEVVFGKVTMPDNFGYLILYRDKGWNILFMHGGDNIYPRAQRIGYEMLLNGECDYGKAMSYSMLSYPYDIHKALRFGDDPMPLDDLVSFLHRHGFALDLNRTDIRQKEMFIRLKL